MKTKHGIGSFSSINLKILIISSLNFSTKDKTKDNVKERMKSPRP